MPWKRNSDLPDTVRSALPEAAQTRFRQVANDRMASGDLDASAIRQAWYVVGRGWEKPKDGGQWVRKSDEQVFLKAEVAKVDAELGLVFGWGIICKRNGEPYFDLQGDHIPEDAMLKVTAEFMEQSRMSGEMHARDASGEPVQDGSIVFSFPLTEEVAKALEIETSQTGWLVAVRPSPTVLEKYRSGEYRGFSIGGSRLVDEDA